MSRIISNTGVAITHGLRNSYLRSTGSTSIVITEAAAAGEEEGFEST